ncbi:hypothetical protein ACFFJY_13785 [Fictibacillus aquaticus]|uniref:DUF4901 domain-containing protein n=1 Tax=Fictibacillus aquaticus TaxID=2021314 RepID=A0A235FDL3_9BACL|nr:hypothetical protein [Fictibacillus aquaticus]OYD59292.1 hypothetical protein CGZ90_05205 [Fictibacillus aquaticus]
MHPLIEELIEKARKTARLDKHHLFSWEIYRKKDALYQTRYLLSMEWFPLGIHKRKKGDLNPSGTAAVEIDMHTKQFNHIIFTESQGSRLKADDVEQWILEVTGLHTSQFTCTSKNEEKFEYSACVNGIPVYPGGTIMVEKDAQGNVILFSKSGFFPNDSEAVEEEFTLKAENLSDVFYEQLKFYDFPSQKCNRWIPLYGVEEVFVTNQDKSRITYDTDKQLTVSINENVRWEESGTVEKIALKPLAWDHETVPIEHVLENRLHPDLVPITQQEIENVKHAVVRFMQNHFPKESGVWNLIHILRDGGYIVALLKKPDDRRAISQWKRLFLKSDGTSVLQMADNDFMLEMLRELELGAAPTLTKEEAFRMLQPYLELKPYYVYDARQNRHVFSGKLDCKYGVAADTGEVLELDDI